MAGKPVLIAAVVCDQAVQEKGSNKWSLIGIFSSMHVQAIPTLYPSLSLYLAIAGVHNEAEIKVTVSAGDGPDRKKLTEFRGALVASDPTAVAESVVRFQPFPIVQEGVHTIEVSSGSEYLGCTRFNVGRLQA